MKIVPLLMILIGAVLLGSGFLKRPVNREIYQSKESESKSSLADFPIQTDSGQVIIHRFFPKTWAVENNQISGPGGISIIESTYPKYAFSFNLQEERVEDLVTNYLMKEVEGQGWEPINLMELPLIQSKIAHMATQFNPQNQVNYKNWVYGQEYQDMTGNRGFRLCVFFCKGNSYYQSVQVKTVDIQAESKVFSEVVENYLQGIRGQYLDARFLASLELERSNIQETLYEQWSIRGWRNQMVVRSSEEKARLYAKELKIQKELNNFRGFSIKYWDWY